MRVSDQVNQAAAGRVQICIPGRQPSPLWTSGLFSAGAELRFSSTQNRNSTKVINFKLSASSLKELTCTCM